MAQSRDASSYEWVCFELLAYELPDDDPSDVERRIKRKLKRRKLGEYQPSRVDALRCLKNALYTEIYVLCRRSRYYRGMTQSTVDYDDFDTTRMAKDFFREFSTIPKVEIERAISFAIYVYYLR